MELTRTRRIYVPPTFTWHDDDTWFVVDPEGPHWVATDDRGAKLLGWLAEGLSFGEVAGRYAAAFQLDSPKAWVHASSFVHDLLRAGFASGEPIAREPYLGRDAYLTPK